MSIEINRGQSGTRVIVTGNADLSLAGALKAALLDALSSPCSQLEVDLTQITQLNVTCLQLLWAAKAEAISVGIPLIILPPAEPLVLENLREASLQLPADTTTPSPAMVCA